MSTSLPESIADLVAEAVALAGLAPVTAAQAALAAAEERLQRARRTAVAIEAAQAEASGALPALVERAVAGETVTMRQVLAAHARARDTAVFASFIAVLLPRLEAHVAAAQQALAEARHRAWMPVLRRGQALRIEAAAAYDAARHRRALLDPMQATPPATAAADAELRRAEAQARPLFDAGTATIDRAVREGARLPPDAAWIPPWPATEASERRHWRLPPEPASALIEETADAAAA